MQRCDRSSKSSATKYRISIIFAELSGTARHGTANTHQRELQREPAGEAARPPGVQRGEHQVACQVAPAAYERPAEERPLVVQVRQLELHQCVARTRGGAGEGGQQGEERHQVRAHHPVLRQGEGGKFTRAGGGEITNAGGEFTSAGGKFARAGDGITNAGGEFTCAGGGITNTEGEFTWAGGRINNAGGEFTWAGGGITNAGGEFTWRAASTSPSSARRTTSQFTTRSTPHPSTATTRCHCLTAP
eukprot:1102148-Prorocentrum_minimum.AAC.1